MKKTMLKLGVFALTFVMLLGCFAACGGGSEADSATDPNMKVKNFNGTTFSYPKDCMVVVDTDAMFTATKLSTMDSITATSVQEPISDEEIAELEQDIENGEGPYSGANISGNVSGMTTCSVDDLSYIAYREVSELGKTLFQTMYNQIVIDKANNICYTNSINILEESSDCSLAKKVLGFNIFDIAK